MQSFTQLCGWCQHTSPPHNPGYPGEGGRFGCRPHAIVNFVEAHIEGRMQTCDGDRATTKTNAALPYAFPYAHVRAQRATSEVGSRMALLSQGTLVGRLRDDGNVHKHMTIAHEPAYKRTHVWGLVPRYECSHKGCIKRWEGALHCPHGSANTSHAYIAACAHCAHVACAHRAHAPLASDARSVDACAIHMCTSKCGVAKHPGSALRAHACTFFAALRMHSTLPSASCDMRGSCKFCSRLGNLHACLTSRHAKTVSPQSASGKWLHVEASALRILQEGQATDTRHVKIPRCYAHSSELQQML